MGMDTEALRWFQQVADGMTVTEVAELDMVSQPGVSRALARLEREVGTPLLQRHGRLLRTTRAGAEFKQHVDSLLHALDDGHAAVNELVDPETGTVEIAFQVSLGGWLVPGLISAFRDDHPRVRFRLEQSDDALGSSRVAGGRVDLEFTARRPRNPEVHWEHLFSQPLALSVPPTHRLAGRRRVSLADVADEEFVMLHPSWALRDADRRAVRRCGVHPTGGLRVRRAVRGPRLRQRGTRGRGHPGGRAGAAHPQLTDGAAHPAHRPRGPPRGGAGVVDEPEAAPVGRAVPSLRPGDRAATAGLAMSPFETTNSAGSGEPDLS